MPVMTPEQLTELLKSVHLGHVLNTAPPPPIFDRLQTVDGHEVITLEPSEYRRIDKPWRTRA